MIKIKYVTCLNALAHNLAIHDTDVHTTLVINRKNQVLGRFQLGKHMLFL